MKTSWVNPWWWRIILALIVGFILGWLFMFQVLLASSHPIYVRPVLDGYKGIADHQVVLRLFSQNDYFMCQYFQYAIPVTFGDTAMIEYNDMQEKRLFKDTNVD